LHPGDVVACHFTGCGPATTRLADIIRNLLQQLGLCDTADWNTKRLQAAFQDCLATKAAQVREVMCEQ